MIVRSATFPARAPGLAWVYVLTTSVARNVSKIGVTVDLGRRLDRIIKNRVHSYELELHCAYQLPAALNGGLAERVEALAHKELYGSEIPGSMDWFFISPTDAERVVLAAIAQAGATATARFPVIIVR